MTKGSNESKEQKLLLLLPFLVVAITGLIAIMITSGSFQIHKSQVFNKEPTIGKAISNEVKHTSEEDNNFCENLRELAIAQGLNYMDDDLYKENCK